MPPDLIPIQSSLLDRLQALDVDVTRLLDRAGLPRARFSQPKARLTMREFFAFWDAVDEADGAHDLGLRLASEAQPQQRHVASLAALCSANLEEALEKLARYKQLSCAPHALLERKRDEARVEVRWTRREGPLPRPFVDGILASALHLAREGTGTRVLPLRLELARRRGDQALLERHFGCEVRFNQPRDQLVLPASALALPFKTHNADLLAWMVPGLEAQLREEGLERSFTDEVKVALERRLCGDRPSVDKLARDLHLSARTLQRRLTEADTSYQALLDEARHAAAVRLLANTDLDTSEVAFLLGFAELNSFSRAFQLWQGTTPLRWLRLRRGQRDAKRAAARLA
jgi:AraC-like DNA-binding protein